jgi:paxillin
MPFKNGQFVEHEGSPYCLADYSQLFCPRCANCQQPIVDKCITAGEKQYHPQHFTCTGCGKNLTGQPYKLDDGEIWCNDCKESRKQRIGIRVPLY